jgi:Domain of Unknown Function (DUF1543)
MKLFLLILGCRPKGRNTEQHDTFFGIGNSVSDLLLQIENFWPNGGKIHIDSWREVTAVNGYAIKVFDKKEAPAKSAHKLFFLNLGGYKPADMEEYHYKLLSVANDKAEAISAAKKTAFYLHTGFKGATSHIDDKYGVDVDDVYEIKEILPKELKDKYVIHIQSSASLPDDKLHIGYLKLSSLQM